MFIVSMLTLAFGATFLIQCDNADFFGVNYGNWSISGQTNQGNYGDWSISGQTNQGNYGDWSISGQINKGNTGN